MDQKYTGIILGKYDIGEADRIYTIYTAEAGKIKAKAVGVKKSQSKLAGSLENFTLGDISIVKKNGIGKITGSIPEKNFSEMRENLEALTSVFWATKIFEQLISMEERDERIFKLLFEYLESTNTGAQGKKENFEILSYGFIFKLLDLLGYKIEAGTCVSCGNKLKRDGNFFSAENGGIVCDNCSQSSTNIIKIGESAIKLIRIFLSNSLKSLLKIKAGEKEAEELKTALSLFLKWIGK